MKNGAAEACHEGPQPAGDEVVAALEFEELKPLKDLGCPEFYYLDEHRQIWPAAVLKAPGSRAEIPRVKDALRIREGRLRSCWTPMETGRGHRLAHEGQVREPVLELGSGTPSASGRCSPRSAAGGLLPGPADEPVGDRRSVPRVLHPRRLYEGHRLR